MGSGSTRVGKSRSTAFPNRVNCRSVALGLAVVAVWMVLVGFYWTHVSTDAAETSVLMSKISKLEDSLLEHHQHEHGELKRGTQEHTEDLERIQGDLTDVQNKVKGAEEEKRTLALVKDRQIQELNRKVEQLESGLSKHEVIAKNRQIQELERKVSSLEAGLSQHESHHKKHIDPHMHTHGPHDAIGESLAKAVDMGAHGLRGAASAAASSSLSAGESALGAGSLGRDTVLLIMASNRPEYLKRCLEKVVHYHPGLGHVPIVVSEDGTNKPVRAVVNDARSKLQLRDPNSLLLHVHHQGHGRYINGYYALADHFQWALSSVFKSDGDGKDGNGITLPIAPKRVIILEEDLEIAPDFFSFFAATAPIVESDPTLLTASAWNDNGQVRNVRDVEQVYRSDFFPGLGWLMTSTLWDELKPKWPKAYWDDWLREPANRLGRHILRPEVCRTLHYGRVGVSNAQYQDTMTEIILNHQPVNFPALDLTYLHSGRWDQYYLQDHVFKAMHTTPEALDRNRIRDKVSMGSGSASGVNLPPKPIPHQEYYIEYQGNTGFEKIAKWAGVMDNIKANVPRTAYKGVVTLWVGDSKLHLVPQGLVSSSTSV